MITDNQHDDFTTKPDNRKITDLPALIVFILFLVVWVAFIMVVTPQADIYRLINGYDRCGNVCGRKNPGSDPNYSCYGKDMTERKYLLLGQKNECVTECPDKFKPLLSRCVPEVQKEKTHDPEKYLDDVIQDFIVCSTDIYILFGVSFVFSILLLFLLRYTIGFIVWFILLGILFGSFAGTIYMWKIWKDEKTAEDNDPDLREYDVKSYLTYAIIATIITGIMLLVIFIMRKRINLVVQLFKEAAKAVAAMPLLIIQPVITTIFGCIVIGGWLLFAISIESAGDLTPINDRLDSPLEFVKDYTILAARLYNLFFLFWMIQFSIGCQEMMIAGAVAIWFFTRNKDKLSAPIQKSYSNLLRFHLGTVACGSLLIAIVNLLQTGLTSLEHQLQSHSNGLTIIVLAGLQCCLWCFRKFLLFFSSNAYIETAIYGYSFCKAGIKAFTILSTNLLQVAAINSIGDTVLLMGKAVIVVLTAIVAVVLFKEHQQLHYEWVLYVVVLTGSYCVAACFVSVYEMVIDTIFICFCEDCDQNDGSSKPYYMSSELMEFVVESQKALDALKKKREAAN